MARISVPILAALLLTAGCRDDAKVCAYFSDEKTIATPEALDGCKAGDVLKLSVRDKGGMGREAFMLADDVARLCDPSRPTTFLGAVAPGNTDSGALKAVCTFNGHIRRDRGRDG